MKRKIVGIITGIIIGILFSLLLLFLGRAIESNEKFIPVLVGMIGALSGLVGVLITNYFNNKNQNERFAFESNQKETERSFNLKKDIYLNAVDELVEIQSSLGQVPNLEFDLKITNNQFFQFCYAINRLQLIANVPTTKQAMQVLEVCSKLYFLMLKERKNLIDLTAESNAIKPYINVYEDEKNRVFRLITDNKLSKNYDQDLDRKFWEEYTNNETRRKDLVERHLNLVEESNLEVHRLNRIYIKGISTVISEINKLNVLIRKDISSDDLIEEYEKILTESSSAAMKYIEEMVNDFEEIYKNDD
ncbi:hypothetical protein F937_03572 [Acinetobacter calcoaceticus ANC 3680]|uniref:hypothetical protein n=1 Tax=Acinetobacter calcoaceticus TaxID=471 RepID=UPI0002CEAC04|nr:hypothetical protein [Acinetobacter calcoaceticus]ENV94168.1 hypothetical protein F937_03572 [Acinetobacter calcoaceticus ANC 3680]